MSKENRSLNVKAGLVFPLPSGTHELGARQFFESRYRLDIPGRMDGTVQMRLIDFETSPVLFSLLNGDASRSARVDAPVKAEDESGPSMDELFSLYQPYVANIAAYEPVYFLVGTEPEKSKFQISLKYLFFDAQSALGRKYPWLQGLHFGYTQTSFWDLKSDSAPFEDTSYKPELFYLSDNLSIRPAWMKGLFIQTGARHESNGRQGDASRSTNILYLKPILVLYDQQSRLGLHISPRFSVYVGNDDDTNHDLPEYRGYLELEVKLGEAEGWVLATYFRSASKGASIQLDLTYPLQRLWTNSVGIYLQAQYSDMLGESLLNYAQRTQAFRLGFAIVR